MEIDVINKIQAKIQGQPAICAFTYRKNNGETTERLVSFGINVGKAFEKRGHVFTGKGNWHKGMTGGQDGMVIERGGDLYVRGIDMGDNAVKIFKVAGIENLR